MQKLTRVKKGIKCPHCGEVIPDVTDVEVAMSKRELLLCTGFGLGVGLLCAAAWSVTWWGALGAFFLSSVVAFMVLSRGKAKKREKVKGK